MRIILASSPNKITVACLKAGKPDNLLFSYYYMKRMNDEVTEEMFSYFKKDGVFIMIDSGAHSFFSEEGLSIAHSKKVKKKETNYEEYAKEYMIWLKKFAKYIDVAVELDIDALIGYPRVLHIRKMLESSGVKIAPVWHTSLGDKEWSVMCDTYDYIGIGLGDVQKSQSILSIGFFADKMKEAVAKKVKVHAFGMIKPNYIMNLPFYSVDSSSWSMGARYGCLCGFDPKTGKLKMGRVKTKEQYIRILQHLHLSMSLESLFSVDRSYMNRDIVNIQAYKALEVYVTNLWKARGIVWED